MLVRSKLTALVAALALVATPVIADTSISKLPTVTSLTGTETVPVLLSDNKTLKKTTTNTLVSLLTLLHWKGAWSSGTAYILNDVVSSSGSSYIAIQAGTNHAVTDTAYWNVLAAKGADGTGTGTVTSVTCGTGLSGGTFTSSGTCSISAPISVANGGTNATSASGTALDNITGFTGTGFLIRSGAGAYGFLATPLPAANGGTGLASGTSGGINCWTGSTSIAVSAALTQYALIVGGGAGACPAPLGSLGTTTTLLHGNAAGAPTFGSIVYADVSGIVATSSQFVANTSSVLNTPNAIWSAAAPVALTDAATISSDMSTGINFSVTLGANRTLGTPANPKAGQSGSYQISQDATGSRLITWPSVFKWASGSACVLSTGASKIDYVFYYVFDSTHLITSCMLDVH